MSIYIYEDPASERNRRKKTEKNKKSSRIRSRLRFSAVIMAAVILILTGFYAVSGNIDVSGHAQQKYITVEVASGDTLWDLAKRYTGSDEMDIREAVYMIKDVNGLSAKSIQPGQMLKIPVSI